MNREIADQYSSIKKVVKDQLLFAINNRLDQQKTILDSARKVIASIEQADAKDTQTLAGSAQYKEQMLGISNQLIGVSFQEFDIEFEAFNKSLEDYISTVDEKRTIIQEPERFSIQTEDGLIIKTIKPLKKFGYGISKWPEKISNGFRKIRGKDKRPLKPWHHTVSLRDLTRYFLKEDFLQKLKPAFDEYYKAITVTSLKLWDVDELLDKRLSHHFSDTEIDESKEFSAKAIDEALVILEETKLSIKKLVTEAFEVSGKAFETHYAKAGTVEFSNSKVSLSRSKNLHEHFLKSYRSFNKNWKNTLIGLTDDWEIDLELYRLIFMSLHEYYIVETEVKERIEKRIFKNLEEVNHFINDWKQQLARAKNDKQLKLLLEENLHTIDQSLRQLVDKNSEFILSQDLPELINNVIAVTSDEVSRVSTRRAIVKGVDFTVPTKSSQINYISPFELINFESAPQLNKVTKEVKILVADLINQAQTILFRLAEIATFNLESAISAINDNDGQDGGKIAQDGLDRTLGQIENVKSSLLKIEEALSESLHHGLKTFSKDLILFTNNENILDLRVRIARGKALDRSKRLKKRAFEIVKNFVPLVRKLVKKYYNALETFIKANFKKLGITSSKELITTELADFLAETEQSIKDLPFVYQRLFRATPLEEVSFFEGRRLEINQLTKAYNQWMQGRFATVLVVGEKGAGITTLFNLYLRELGNSCDVIRVTPTQNINSEQMLFVTFEKAFGFPIKTFDDLVEGLNAGERRIIVLENLQKLYLRKVGGFYSVKLVTELISLTSKNIFWLIGCTEYAYNYLNKTISLPEHFSYNVTLENLSDDDIINVIERRHRVSGYNLEFEPANGDLNSKKYKKMIAGEQREYLKSSYFSDLNKVAKSNISLALIYWLRSTKQASGNTILITSLKNIDFSFMKGLSYEKINVLNMLLLNDGLSENEIAEVTNQSVQKNRSILYPLFEDGIIIRQKDIYFINPLLYRQTVNLLKTKNIVH
jgi:hypothetical protein